jgi:hypothetical protein
MDFKTGNPSEDKIDMYSRQLHAYAFALENSAEGAMELSPISLLGLLYFTPESCKQSSCDRQILEGKLSWIKVERNEEEFINFLQGVINLLDGPIPAPEEDACDWCSYSKMTRYLLRESGDLSKRVNIPNCPICGGPMHLRTGKFGDFWS